MVSRVLQIESGKVSFDEIPVFVSSFFLLLYPWFHEVVSSPLLQGTPTAPLWSPTVHHTVSSLTSSDLALCLLRIKDVSSCAIVYDDMIV